MLFTILSHNNARSQNDQRRVRERSEYSLTVLSSEFAREILGRNVGKKITYYIITIPERPLIYPQY